MVGVNEFTVSETTSLRLLKVDPAVRERQMARLAALKQRRDNGKVQTLLAKLEQTAAGDTNLVPIILECVETYATLGEICGVLRRVFGEYKPTVAL